MLKFYYSKTNSKVYNMQYNSYIHIMLYKTIYTIL